MNIGELNRRIIMKSWGSTQDEGGGPIAIVLSSYTIWAKVEQRSGQPYTGQQQELWNYDYKITFRYEKSRVAKSNETIDYDGKRLSINSLAYSEEGNRKYCIARCSTVDANINTARDIYATLHTFDYYGIDHETSFTADGTPMTLPTVAQDLRGKTIVGAFKDGIEFAVILTGLPNLLAKEVLYNSAVGSFTWSQAFEPNEHSLIQYL